METEDGRGLHTVKRRVLLVEGDRAACETLGDDLRTAGVDVDVLADGHQLLARLQSIHEGGAPPDVLVADAQLPSCSGLGCIERMHLLGLRIPTVVMTRGDDPPAQARATQLGATPLAKPVARDALLAAVDLALAS